MFIRFVSENGSADEGFAYIISDCYDILQDIRLNFSCPNKLKLILRKKNPFVAKRLPARIESINPKGRVEIGLIPKVISYIRKHHPLLAQDIIVDDIIADMLLPSNLKGTEVFDDFGERVMRYYQRDGLETAIERGRGIFKLGTGAGKSLVIASLVQSILNRFPEKKILITVPTKILLDQMHSDIKEYDIPATVTRWGGKHKPDESASACIITNAMLLSRFDKTEIFKTFDIVICDECHTISEDAKISACIRRIPTPNKFGFTGTLSDEPHLEWGSYGKFGSIVVEKNGAELRAEDFLSDVVVLAVKVSHKDNNLMKFDPKENRQVPYEFADELDYLVKCDARNEELARVAGTLKNNTLILVNRVEHGERLLALIKEQNPDRQCSFIRGSMEDEERDSIKKEMEIASNCICIAMSSIFSAGVNITNIHNIVFPAQGKAFIKTVQSIGRGLRKHPTKRKLYIIDFYDNIKYSLRHFEKRKAIYAAEGIKVRDAFSIDIHTV